MLVEKIKMIPFSNVSEADVSDISFEPSLLELCKLNQCGNYGKCYTCPPIVGDIDTLVAKAKSFVRIIVFQKVYKIEDSFDIEGMDEAVKDFAMLVQKVNEICKSEPYNLQVLGAGGCRLCERCGIIDNIECRFPDRAVPSLESYGINVSKLAQICGMKYINGQNTVTYFGGVLY